jgi:hypothetical protein
MSDTFTSFSLEDHNEFLRWLAPLRAYGFRRGLCREHEELPDDHEVIEVYLPRQDTYSFEMLQTDDGRVLLDDLGSGDRWSFATMAEALAQVDRQLADVKPDVM